MKSKLEAQDFSIPGLGAVSCEQINFSTTHGQPQLSVPFEALWREWWVVPLPYAHPHSEGPLLSPAVGWSMVHWLTRLAQCKSGTGADQIPLGQNFRFYSTVFHVLYETYIYRIQGFKKKV